MTILSDIRNQTRITTNLLLSNKIWLMGGLLFTLLFVVISYYSFNNYIKPLISGHKLNSEFKKTGVEGVDDVDDISIMYFYTEWCPYCKKAEPEWVKFEEYVDNINNTNDYKVILSSINCDEKKSIADKHEVVGYPTVKLFYKGNVHDFDAKVTKDNLVEFLNSVN
jgi:thiol-disulfide isomerase/thioredoxin